MLTIKTPLLAAVAAVAVLFTALPKPALADPPGWHHSHKHKVKHHQKRKYRGAWERRHNRYHRRAVHHRHNHYPRSDNSPSLFDGINGGHILGGLLGAVAGTQIGKGKGRSAAIIGGGILGAVLGGGISKSMQRSDRMRTQSALETTRTGQTVSWVNPDTGSSYNMTPTRTYRTTQGANCRDYSLWAFIDGYEEEVKGTACRGPDGAWQTASN